MILPPVKDIHMHDRDTNMEIPSIKIVIEELIKKKIILKKM